MEACWLGAIFPMHFRASGRPEKRAPGQVGTGTAWGQLVSPGRLHSPELWTGGHRHSVGLLAPLTPGDFTVQAELTRRKQTQSCQGTFCTCHECGGSVNIPSKSAVPSGHRDGGSQGRGLARGHATSGGALGPAGPDMAAFFISAVSGPCFFKDVMKSLFLLIE